MGLWASIFYICDITLLGIYLLYKFYLRGYVFSCFNISLFIYAFSIFISPIYYSTQRAWLSLGVNNYVTFFGYLDDVIIINSAGFIITLITVFIYEFKQVKAPSQNIFKVASSINNRLLDYSFIFIILAWYFIVLTNNNGGLPLFNGGRTFFLHTATSSVYLGLNELILLYSLYYGTKFVYKKSKTSLISFIIALITLLFTGSRGTVLISAFVPIAILFFYKISYDKYKIRYGKSYDLFKTYARKARFNATFKIIIILFITAFIGLLLVAIRNQKDVSLVEMIFELLYGNTFSDIRDGAYILYGYREKFGDSLLWGKTYLAGILSFIPGSLSEFKTTWLWGNFTTTGLFGWGDHFGLRGGNVMEAYLNFSIVGLVIYAIIQGLIIGFLERNFYKVFLLDNVKYSGKEYFYLYIISSLNNFFVNTGGMFNLYIDLIFIILIIILSNANRAVFFKKRLS